MTKRPLSLAAIGLIATTLSLPVFGDTPTFRLTDLGTLGGSGTSANAINDAGQVAGSSLLAGDTVAHPFLWRNGVMTDLGTLGGARGQAFGINSLGQVVGSADLPGNAATHAFLFSDGVMHDLGTLPGFTNSVAQAINTEGQVVGRAFNAVQDSMHAFLYSGGVMTDLGTLGGATSFAQSINSSGQVVGFSDLAGNTERHGFLYSDGVMRDLGTLGGNFSGANGINDLGQIVGVAGIAGDGNPHAFLSSGGPLTDLGAVPGATGAVAAAINNTGQVVGVVLLPEFVAQAFRYSDGVLRNLNDLILPNSLPPGDFLFDAGSINASGQIPANGLVNGRAYLLTPIGPLAIISPPALPPGRAEVPYGPVTFVASGGAGGNTWTASGLPNGLAIDPATGVLRGTPASQGVFPNATFEVRDADGATASVTLSLTINSAGPPPPVITSVSPSTVAGSNDDQKFCVNGSFADGPALKVRLSWPGGQADLPEDVFNPIQLCVRFNFSIAIGEWTAQAINGDGQLSNIFLFPVAEPGQVPSIHLALPHFVFGGPWSSAVYFSNTTNATATVQITFRDDAGDPLFVPLGGLGSLFSRLVTLNPGATAVLQAQNGGDVTAEGWADVLLPPGVVGYGVFRQTVEGRADQEALVSFNPETAQTADFTYDETRFTTSVAFLNPSNQQITVTINAFGPDGAQAGSAQITLAANTKSASVLRELPGMAGIGGKQGRVVVSTPNGAVSVLALRFGGAAFTDIPINYR